MRAARIREFGGPGVIRIEDIPRPEPGPGQVLVEVAATSFNPTELALRSGALRQVVPVSPPLTLGWDFAGTIAEVGAGVRGHAPGDRVVGWTDGAAAEFAVASTFVAAPGRVPLVDAAAIPLAGLTAWQAVEQARIEPGERVLVNGAGGGIGGFVVQLARRAGARVIATAGPRSAAAVRRFGAERLIDYTTTSLGDALDGPVDLLFNLVGLPKAEGDALVRLVKPGGRVVSVTNHLDVPHESRVRAAHVLVRNDPRDLQALVSLVDDGEIELDVTEHHALAELPRIHRRGENGEIRGKVVIVIRA
ncbi:NADP-dependent oxidoreductase [Amycolatopsis magusensis]|uniref:NADP-dependent oxidoreductase n=1 Tax=Amycolatopsis magusensis TaxID=882444 RepID=UPI003797F4AD